MKPIVSVIIVNFNMDREIVRTVESFMTPYQLGITSEQVEIIVVDNGSKNIPTLPNNVKIIVIEEPNCSPAKAVNIGIKEARGNLIGVVVDGARMASPGVLKYALACTKIVERPIITVLGFHIGPDLQSKSMLNGYSQKVEDELLKSIHWEQKGYKLFDISVFAGSNRNGWFGQVAESNALFMTKEMWQELDGLDEKFISLGGGFVNLDTYKRALSLENSQNFILLGEGTFHQFHGGVTTNQPFENIPFEDFQNEYKKIRNEYFKVTETHPAFIGTLPDIHKQSLIRLSSESTIQKNDDIEEKEIIYKKSLVRIWKKLFGKLC